MKFNWIMERRNENLDCENVPNIYALHSHIYLYIY